MKVGLELAVDVVEADVWPHIVYAYQYVYQADGIGPLLSNWHVNSSQHMAMPANRQGSSKSDTPLKQQMQHIITYITIPWCSVTQAEEV